MIKYGLLIFFSLQMSFFAAGQNSLKSDSINKAIILELKDREIETYKRLVDTAEKSKEDLRETNNWFIGTLIGFILLVLGTQIFYNVQLNTRKIESIRDSLKLEFENYKTAAGSEILGKVDELNKLIEAKTKEQLQQLDRRFDLQSRAQDVEIELIRKEYEFGFKGSQSRFDKMEAEIWLLKGVEVNALSGFLNSAIKQVELNEDVKYTLLEINRILKEIDKIPEYVSNKIDELMKILAEKQKGRYLDELVTLKNLLETKDVYTIQKGMPAFSSLVAGMMNPYQIIKEGKRINKDKK